MDKKDKNYYKILERIHFSKQFKRAVLLEYSRLKKPNSAFEACGFDISKFNLNDKKYSSKLLYKWRNELYNNRHMLGFMNTQMDDIELKNEIDKLEKLSDNFKTDKLSRTIEIMEKAIPNPDEFKSFDNIELEFDENEFD